LWNTTTWSQIRKMKSSSTYNWIDGLAFSLDGKYLYVGEYNNNISVWDVATGISIKTLSGHTNHVWSIAISPDGKVLASASADRTVKLWDVASGSLIKTLTDPKDELFNIAFSRDGSKLVASSDDKNVYIWTMKGITGGKIETFTETVTALPPYLNATATFADADGDNLLKGGESGKVTFIIKNTGKGPALGVNAKFTITEGSLGLFLGTPTFYIGDIQPGAEKTITSTVDATEDVLTQKVSMKVEATEKNGFGADAIIVNFNTKAQEPPLLAVSKYVLRDDGSGQSQGNGDGVIQKKETVELTVFLTNTGQGAANSVKLTLKSSDPGIFVSQSSATLGDIPPGEVKKGVFVFAVSGNYNTVSSTLPLNIEISEKRPKFNKSENLGLSLDASYKKEVVVDVVSNFKEENKTVSMGNIKDKVDQAVKDMNLAISKSGASEIELPARENVYAVVIGISEYKSKDVPPLSYAVNDASGVYALLTNNVIGGIPKANVKFLAGPEATLTEIKVALGWLVNQGMEDENAVLMFYYSGHGAPEQDDEGNVKTAFLIPFDGQPKFLAETGIGIDYLQQELGKVKAKNVFVAMDACFTGSGRSFMKQGARGINLVPKEIIKESVEGKVFLTAAANDQSAFDDPQNKHGLFTNFLLEALSGKGDSDAETGNNDGWVSSNEVFNYLKDRVSKAARKLENVKQDPQMIGFGEIKLTRTFQKKAGSMTVDEKKAKLGKALNSAAINMDQYAKALTEIKSGNESAVLKDFLAAKIDAKKFGESY
ncbi:caspase family protein, partial [bacterium]|nr:caspase family protein [bacterium]